MKVLLIEPPVSPFDIPTKVFAMPPPHHIERLAGPLITHHDVRIFDMRIDQDLQAELAEFQPDIVGCSCVAANSHIAKNILKEIKETNPEILTVVGGHHPSLAPEDFRQGHVDVVVVGEGEATLKDLVANYQHGPELSKIKGIAYRTPEGTFRMNPPRELIDLDKTPLPARHLTRKYRKRNRYFRANWRPVDCIISSRGCPFRCTFCGLWKINRGEYRYRDPRLVADELQKIQERNVLFVDDNTLDHVQKALGLAEIIGERGFDKQYEVYGRADTIVQHPQVVEKWRGIGMKLLLIGLEAFDDGMLSGMNKRTTAAMNRKAIEICHANGVEIAAYFIVHPNFDRDDFKRLLDFVMQNNLTHPVFAILTPFPGTDLYEQVKDHFLTDRLEILDFFHTVLPTRLPLEDFYREFARLYKKAYKTKDFIGSVFKGKAVLTPRMLSMIWKVRKHMADLRRHHDLIAEDTHKDME
jgi:radical SAM superfamily enzyme YgiQ (UPF0313 family)